MHVMHVLLVLLEVDEKLKAIYSHVNMSLHVLFRSVPQRRIS